jgi:glycosyltransferase involved in cell wall biosynthesis
METVGDATHLISPKDFRELAQALIRMLEDSHEREHCSSAGLRRASGFSWERTASATLDVYRGVLQKEKREIEAA